MNIIIEELAYGTEKVITLKGKYVKTLARAVNGGQPIVNAELMLMTENTKELTQVKLTYAEYGTMSEYVFFNLEEHLRNNADLIDVVSFNYVVDEAIKTGVIIVERKRSVISKWRHGRTGIVSRFCWFLFFSL